MVRESVFFAQDFGELLESIHQTPIATIVTDNRRPDNPILDANQAFIRLTGYDREEILGRNCRFLAGRATEPDVRTAVRNAVSRGDPIVAEMVNYRKDGSPFRNVLMIAPVRDSGGNVVLFLGSQMDAGSTECAGGLRTYRSRQLVAGLTPRLRQVLGLMSAGYRSKQIGGALGIGERTVKMHRARLKKALGVRTSADAIRIALEAELLLNDFDRPRTAR